MMRRNMLRASLLGLAGLGLRRRARAAAPGRPPADALIVLWLQGGPSHLDTFDPKPGTRQAGAFRAIATGTRGLQLCEHLPRLAALSDRMCVVRSMTTKEGNHERAQFLMHTGYAPNPTAAHPSIGAWVSRVRGDARAPLPSFVSIGGPSIGPGLLGVEHAPLVVRRAGEPPANLDPRIDRVRQARRLAVLGELDGTFGRLTRDPAVEARRTVMERAVRLVVAPERTAFDLSTEPAPVRAAYGSTEFGQGCLLARRLVESGCRAVEVVLDGWDVHENAFERQKGLCSALDQGFSTLVRDLGERHLLERTVVVCLGEFGRTPDVNAREGRDHWPGAWSLVLAGGGLRVGRVHGATDATGAHVIQDAVSVPDLFATLAVRLGLDPGLTISSPTGRPIALTQNGAPIAALLG